MTTNPATRPFWVVVGSGIDVRGIDVLGQIFDFSGIEKSEKSIKKTWQEFRDALSKGDFSFDDIASAKKNTFLRVYDDLFNKNAGIEYNTADGIRGHANLVAVEAQKGTAVAAMGVASMIVGQYYMTQINAELGVISDGISQIQNFQDNEYRSRVFSLVAHVKKIADFQTEILENDELRLSKIAQLDSLEEECTKLLGQANLTLAGFAKKSGLNYDGYEKALGNAQNWFMYQQSLLEILYKISDLRYTLHLGTVSREQCMALLPTYSKQVSDTQTRLTAWHEGTADRLGIEADESRRKRAGFDGVIHFIPGLFNDNLNFRGIEEKTASMITAQKAGHVCTHKIDKSEFSISFCSSFMRCSAAFIPSRIEKASSLTEEREASNSSRVEIPCSAR